MTIAVATIQEAPTASPLIRLNMNMSGSPKKHEHYYLQDGNVVIQVEDTLFKLDLSMLHAKSPVFRIIVPPVYGGRTCYMGFDDEHPFVLREISATDFERLLWVLYPLNDTKKRPTTVEEWLSILKLSTKFQIDDIRFSFHRPRSKDNNLGGIPP
ncbi:hypothetical protein AX15_004336 [Amanita polypyramis BW_CC]|nr:hypothetical protein AX15_004336 [Amanita polypyramis BW_CC]